MSVVLLLRVGRGSLEAQVVRRRRTLWAGTASYASPDELADAVAQFAAEVSLPVRPTRLRAVLEPPLVQLRTLRGLPPVRGTALDALVTHQAGRFFRRNGAPLVTAAAWERRTHGAARVARAAAVEELWVGAIAAGARAAGLELERIEPFDLRSPAERARSRGLQRIALRKLTVAVAVLWAAAVAVVVARVARERRRIDRELATLDAPVRMVIAARRKLTDAARMVETIDGADASRGATLRLAAGIIAALPDSAYLTSLDIDTTGAGTVTGAAKQAVEVVAALEKSGAARAPTLAGPAVREMNAGREWERFTIRFGPRPR